ncbi:hypothetical protein CEXT_708401 [Caerostris extrusa]|uniref:Uncharacterized protein n=1 Tax=Caerostris extrusa TaxID=172846 RepID=A0AAV4SV23_CAEEX|nr:hypothetical protein CEXT_708401 [Caerostris extrusa]
MVIYHKGVSDPKANCVIKVTLKPKAKKVDEAANGDGCPPPPPTKTYIYHGHSTGQLENHKNFPQTKEAFQSFVKILMMLTMLCAPKATRTPNIYYSLLKTGNYNVDNLYNQLQKTINPAVQILFTPQWSN